MKYGIKKLEKVNEVDSLAIAEIASAEQRVFESRCGGRELGQEIMVVCGILRYYTTEVGFGENLIKAQAMVKGLRQSSCSIEVHSIVEEVASLFEQL